MNDLIECMCRFAEANEKEMTKEFCAQFKSHLQRQFPGEKIYIQAPDTSRREAIAAAARNLPTGVVAARHGVTDRYVRMIVKKRN